MSAVGSYREFRRVAFAVSGLLFGAGLVVALLYSGTGGSFWVATKWSAVLAPLIATLAVALAITAGWSRAGDPISLRMSAILWILIAVELPWVAAWFGADAAGGWFAGWWQNGNTAREPGLYLWVVRILAGLFIYALASALGVLATFLIDERLTSDKSGKV